MVLSQELEDLTCNICSKDFNTYTSLKIHSRQFHNEDPVSDDYKEKLEGLNLTDTVIEGLLKDFSSKKVVTQMTENDIIKLSQDKSFSDRAIL